MGCEGKTGVKSAAPAIGADIGESDSGKANGGAGSGERAGGGGTGISERIDGAGAGIAGEHNPLASQLPPPFK